MNDNIKKIRSYIKKKLNIWKEYADTSKAVGELANLRHNIGKKPGELPQVWNILFEDFPEELMSRNGEPTYAEWAISITLSMYALHQQGKDIRTSPMHIEGYEHRIGRAIRSLVEGDANEDNIRSRFNIFATSSDITECSYHLRGIVQLLKAKDIPLDYVSLADDLYKFQLPDGPQKVRLVWGQDFYRR